MKHYASVYSDYLVLEVELGSGLIARHPRVDLLAHKYLNILMEMNY